MPQYLGPSAFQLVHLFLLIVANSIVLFALVILLIRTVWCLAINNTTIEVWEIERHETLLRRARYLGGYLDGPDGAKVHIVRQEFPYDIGIWRNFRQGMGTGNVCFSLNSTALSSLCLRIGKVLAWCWPFATSPTDESGLHYETNGLEGKPFSFFSSIRTQSLIMSRCIHWVASS